MQTVYSEDHRHQDGKSELVDGRLQPCFERPRRAEIILNRLREQQLGPVVAPEAFDLNPVLRVHDPNFVRFLETAWDAWLQEHFGGDLSKAYDALPICWPVRDMLPEEPVSIDGKLSYYSFDAGTPITAGTWIAARAGVAVTLSALKLVQGGERAAFALCRPPGHHASRDVYGGYCFLNNAAIAAQALIDAGHKRVAILDIDYHHGNGTQAIFYDRPDVFFASIHADPAQEFPFFLGRADERGAGEGEGANLNLPLPWGTGIQTWSAALARACQAILDHGSEVVIVSLGLDTFREDPISRFALDSADYPAVGALIAQMGLPTLFVMEGGYAIDALGVNTVGLLQGFDQAT